MAPLPVGVGSLYAPNGGKSNFQDTRQNDHVSKKIATCPTKTKDSDTSVYSAKTSLSQFRKHPLSLLLSLPPVLICLLPSMSVPVAIASTHSSPRNCTSGNQVLGWKFVAFANAGMRLPIRKQRSHLPFLGLWTLIPGLDMSQLGRLCCASPHSFDHPSSAMR